MKQKRPYPQAIITKKGARLLASGHCWVFAGEAIRIDPAPETSAMPQNGGIVDVVEENGSYHGTGLISEKSTIRIRIVTKNANDRLDENFWARKVRWAWEYRKTVMGNRTLPGCEPDTSCCRIIFSEADGSPGLIVDRYEDILVAQVGTVGMQRLRQVIYSELLDALAEDDIRIQGIYERNDGAVRDREGLAREKGWFVPEAGGPAPKQGWPELPQSAHAVVHENGLAFDADFEHSQKTGFFLDQKYTRRAVREIAAGKRVLDCFSHVGPFGLNAVAGGAAFARCVDVSETALELAEHNAKLNDFDDRMAFTSADVLEYLPELAKNKGKLREAGGPFDLIILDPPAFTKSRNTIERAKKGYREINYEALKLLPRGGYLATCSCSHFMTADLLKKEIARAARDANVQLRQIVEMQQAPDHPILWGVPETHYLDFFIFQVI